MRDFDFLLPEIMVRAPECAEPVAIAAIRDALTELCEQVRCWHVNDTFTVPTGKPRILLAPAGTMMVEIDEVSHHGRPLEAITWQTFRDRTFGHLGGDTGAVSDWWQTSGQPQFYTQEVPNELLIVPHQGGERVRIAAYLKPGPEATEGPDWALAEYRLALRDGALSRILDIPGQPFSDPQKAALYMTAWESAKNRAYAKWVQGQQRGPMRTRARFF